jgi:hypothetical protein
MIVVARSLVERAPGVKMTWHCASALSMPFDEGAFDLEFCLNGLQFLPDYAAGAVATRHPLSRLSVEKLTEFLREMDVEFRQYEEGGGVATPQEQLILVGRAG